MIKILIADDHAIMREGLKQILSGCGDMQVADEADNGADALKIIRQQRLDVVLLDMSMPGRNGIELIKQIRSESPKLPILVLSMHKENQYAGRTLKAGASGYLCKDGASAQLVAAIRKVAAGGIYISPEAAQELALGVIAGSDSPPHTLLSDREFQVLKLLAAGNGITAIADQLNVSVKTISTHKTRLMVKLNITSTASLIRYAIKHNLADAPDV